MTKESRKLGAAAIAVVAVSATPVADRMLAAPGTDAADTAMAGILAEAIQAGMRFLADDLLEGRGTGTRGHEIAAKYMATQFEAIGLEPAGDNGTYFQTVPLRKGLVDEGKSSLTLVRGGREEKLVFRENFIVFADADRAETNVEAPVVFVGDGVTAPEFNYDDYKRDRRKRENCGFCV